MTETNWKKAVPKVTKRKDKVVAFTFDDGPDTIYTPRILDILHHYQVKATFMCCGEHINSNQEMLKRMVREGHEIANHTWNHPNLTEIAPSEVHRQIEDTSNIIYQIIGQKPRLFRPPYGKTNKQVMKQCKALGYKVILWDIDSRDWTGILGPQVAANILLGVKTGSIILQHNGWSPLSGTVDALPYCIEILCKQGFRFLTVSELLGIAPYFNGSA
ncbi:polysaccharide deacetylase family protein [Paenibacillus sp. sgz302251]|uniref:polysaccharide deacetylase family protein n=1 Tax=Paenibacillus sp. sgz302251 TaxID=3414493 RepID=UPI003C7EB771